MKFLYLLLIFSFLSFGNLHAYVNYADRTPLFEKYPMDIEKLSRTTEFNAEELALIKSFLQKANVANTNNLLHVGGKHAKESALHFLLAFGDFENAKLYVEKYGDSSLRIENSEGILAFVRMLPSTRQHMESSKEPARNLIGIQDWFNFLSQKAIFKQLLKHKDNYKQSMLKYIKEHETVYKEYKDLPYNRSFFRAFDPLRRLRGFSRR